MFLFISETYTYKTQVIATYHPCQSDFMRYETFGVLPEYPNSPNSTDYKVHLKAVIGNNVKLDEWKGLKLENVKPVLRQLNIDPKKKSKVGGF